MRFLLPCIVLTTAAFATAQSPLSTTFANNNGGAVGGGVYYTLTSLNPAGVTICQLEMNFSSAAGTAGSIEVYVNPAGTTIPHTLFAANPSVSSGTAVAAGIGLPTKIDLVPPIFIPGGTTVGIGVEAVGLAHAYTNGTNAYPVPGNIFATAELEMNAGQGSNVFAAGGAFTPRVANVNVFYVDGNVPCPPKAICESQGEGCDAKYRSMYELFDRPNFDLAGGWLVYTALLPGGYDVQFVPACPIEPVGLLGPPAVAVLPDDGQWQSPGTLVVGSNGWCATGGGNSNSFVPNIDTMLNNPSQAWYSWKDINPASTAPGNGAVFWESDASGRLERVTFDNVYIFGGTTPADQVLIQFTYDNNTGDMIVSWGQNTPQNGTEWLVGYAPGNPPNLDGGPTDLSSLVAPTTGIINAVDQPSLGLICRSLPIIGTTQAMETIDMPPTTLIHVGWLGLQRPGLPLIVAGIPAPNCFLNASFDVSVDTTILPPGPTHNWLAIAIPNNPIFFGFQYNAQSAIFGTPKNPAFNLGLLTSNGMKMTIGGF